MPSPEPTTETAMMLSRLLLAEARSDTARKWTAQALCAGADPELFSPPGDGPATEARHKGLTGGSCSQGAGARRGANRSMRWRSSASAASKLPGSPAGTGSGTDQCIAGI
jgi:hypothetical protein